MSVRDDAVITSRRHGPASAREVIPIKVDHPMPARTTVLPSGARIRVPEHIQRIDTRSTHGWQLRYGKPTMFFSDSKAPGANPRASLKLAIAALRKRLASMPAPTGLQRAASSSKQNDLPAGISGPILRQRPGRSAPECHFSVNLPRFGDKPLRRSVYIANQNTYSKERYQEALDAAIALRKQAEEEYQKAATAAKKREAKQLAAA